MPCKWGKKPCIRGACSEWDCAGLNDPEECRHWIPEAKTMEPAISIQPEIQK